jgi:D-arabinose 1-dehydrogenase-like Zn-dependent alcohol dehydrogenase
MSTPQAVEPGDAEAGVATMRAIRQWDLGGPDVIRLVECPQPVPEPTEVLVRVAAAGVTRSDCHPVGLSPGRIVTRSD